MLMAESRITFTDYMDFLYPLLNSMAQRRFQSTTPASSSNAEHAFMKARLNQPSFSKLWLSDPTTYPIIVVVGFAVGMCASTMSYYMMACKDVQVSPAKRQGIIRTWGEGPGRFGN